MEVLVQCLDEIDDLISSTAMIFSSINFRISGLLALIVFLLLPIQALVS